MKNLKTKKTLLIISMSIIIVYLIFFHGTMILKIQLSSITTEDELKEYCSSETIECYYNKEYDYSIEGVEVKNIKKLKYYELIDENSELEDNGNTRVYFTVVYG